MLFLSGFWDNVGAAIIDGLRSLMLSLCEVIYKLIIFFFDIFLMLGNASLLEDSIVEKVYGRVGLILGLFMVFRVIFSLIQYVINPDIMMDKQKGLFNIVKKVFIVVVLLGTTKYLFNLAYDAQKLIINSNVIPKIITGKNVSTDNFGATLADYTFTSFYRYDELTTDDDRRNCSELFNGIISEDLKRNNTLRYAFNCVNAKGGSGDEQYYIIQFDGNGLIAVIVGLFILWMIVMYVIQVGVRVVQLAYLQLIAPIPIVGYLAPKGEETFNKWVKQCTTTYLDFFLRVAIIYLVIFIIQLLVGNDNQHFVNSLGDVGEHDMFWINIIMILALLFFAQKVPKLFKELFPGVGGAAGFSFGLNPKKEVLEPLKAAYNSPLGWAPKALGWAGKKTIGAIDRKVHNLPKPRNKIQQYFDKLAPGHAEVVKNRQQAIIDENQRQKNLAKGENLYKSYDKIEDAFKNSKYKESYAALGKAKSDAKKAELVLSQEQANLNAAYNYFGEDRDEVIAKAKKRYEIAYGNNKAMQGKLELAKAKHDSNKKIYTDDAKKEELYKYYSDTHSEPKPLDSSTSSSVPLQSEQQQSAQQQPVQQQSTQQSEQQQSSQSQSEQNGETVSTKDIYVSETDIDDAYSQLYELTGSGASSDEVNQQLNWINELIEENSRNLEEAYQKLYDLTGSGASQNEIDNQIKIINDIKSGEIK